MDDSQRPATAKQQAFARGVVENRKSLAQSYRDSYETQASSSVVRVAASKLWRNPSVQVFAEGLRREAEAQRGRRLSGEREWIRNRLTALVEDPETPASSVVKALQLLGSQTGVSMWSQDAPQDAPAVADADLVESIRQTLLDALEPTPEIEQVMEIEPTLIAAVNGEDG